MSAINLYSKTGTITFPW